MYYKSFTATYKVGSLEPTTRKYTNFSQVTQLKDKKSNQGLLTSKTNQYSFYFFHVASKYSVTGISTRSVRLYQPGRTGKCGVEWLIDGVPVCFGAIALFL